MTTEQLLAAIALDGHETPSEAQLKRWAARGLLPRSVQHHPPGRPGSTTRWPPGTLGRLSALLDHHEHERRLDRLAFKLWWDGHGIEPTVIRPILAALIDQFIEPIRAVRRQHPDPFDAADAAVTKARQSQGRSPAFRLLRSRVGGNDGYLDTAMHTFFLLAFGGEPQWDNEHDDPAAVDEPSVRDLIGRAMSFDHARTDRIAGGEPWLAEVPDVARDLSFLRDAGIFDVDDPARLILEASDTALDQARRDAVLFCDQLTVIVEAAEIIFGRDIAGLGSLSTMGKGRDGDQFRAYFVRYCLLLRDLVPEGSIEQIAAVTEAAVVVARGVVDLRAAFPKLKPYLKGDSRARLAKLPTDTRQRVFTRVTTFIDSRPHLSAALDRYDRDGDAIPADDR